MLRIYPHRIDFKGQICCKSQSWEEYSTGREQLSKQVSMQTTLTNSQAEDSSFCKLFTIEEDVRNVFILILQMATLKPYSYFYSQKHQAILWDAVGGVLSSAAVARLSIKTLTVLQQCFDGKMLEGDWLFSQIDEIIKSRVNMCKTITLQKNEQLTEKMKSECQQRKARRLSTLNFPASTPSRLSFHRAGTN